MVISVFPDILLFCAAIHEYERPANKSMTLISRKGSVFNHEFKEDISFFFQRHRWQRQKVSTECFLYFVLVDFSLPT